MNKLFDVNVAGNNSCNFSKVDYYLPDFNFRDVFLDFLSKIYDVSKDNVNDDNFLNDVLKDVESGDIFEKIREYKSPYYYIPNYGLKSDVYFDLDVVVKNNFELKRNFEFYQLYCDNNGFNIKPISNFFDFFIIIKKDGDPSILEECDAYTFNLSTKGCHLKFNLKFNYNFYCKFVYDNDYNKFLLLDYLKTIKKTNIIRCYNNVSVFLRGYKIKNDDYSVVSNIIRLCQLIYF